MKIEKVLVIDKDSYLYDSSISSLLFSEVYDKIYTGDFSIYQLSCLKKLSEDYENSNAMITSGKIKELINELTENECSSLKIID